MAPGPDHIELNLPEARSAAAQLAAVGAQWREVWVAHRDRIAELVAAKPWGDDEAGQAMYARWIQPMLAALQIGGEEVGKIYESIAGDCDTVCARFEQGDHRSAQEIQAQQM